MNLTGGTYKHTGGQILVGGSERTLNLSGAAVIDLPTTGGIGMGNGDASSLSILNLGGVDAALGGAARGGGISREDTSRRVTAAPPLNFHGRNLQNITGDREIILHQSQYNYVWSEGAGHRHERLQRPKPHRPLAPDRPRRSRT